MYSHLWESEDIFLESIFSFYHVGPGDKNQTQVILPEKAFVLRAISKPLTHILNEPTLMITVYS